jgi:hypothetical protein
MELIDVRSVIDRLEALMAQPKSIRMPG